jgi:hypothetical protein
MKVIVFTGPTLSPREVVEVIDATCLPPVSQGDVYRAVACRPDAIGIIDGYFERVPAVWHKEILWAMGEGVHVFGSASMGALRAAELVSFGMAGVGAVFEAYRDGVLEDDDEVALVHGRSEDDYRAGSEPMVNIRATLARAGAEGILGEPARGILQRTAKELFYAERSYARILELAAVRGAPPAELEAFRRWLPEGAVNQKRDDALAMLRAMREFLATDPGPKCVSYVFEETMYWEVLRRSAGEVAPEPQSGADALVLDQLRRDPEAMERARGGGWLPSGRAAKVIPWMPSLVSIRLPNSAAFAASRIRLTSHTGWKAINAAASVWNRSSKRTLWPVAKRTAPAPAWRTASSIPCVGPAATLRF